MLTIHVPGVELFDDEKQEFQQLEGFVLELEHSLVSLSKWESKWQIPFLEPNDKTPEQAMDYVVAMTLTPDVPPDVFRRLGKPEVEAISAYIDNKMTATWFSEMPGGSKSREIMTAELVYHWMIEFGIPLECENWHLNRLFTLIRVRNAKLTKPEKQKVTADDLAARRALNKKRREELGTRG